MFEIAMGDNALAAPELKVGLRGTMASASFCWSSDGNSLVFVGPRGNVEMRQLPTFMIANMALGRSSPIVASCLTFVYMTSTGANLTVANVLAALTCFQSLRLPLIMIPLQITILVRPFWYR